MIELYVERNNLDIALGTKPNCVSTQEKRENVKLKTESLEQHKELAVQVRDGAEWIEKVIDLFLGQLLPVGGCIMCAIECYQQFSITGQLCLARGRTRSRKKGKSFWLC